MRKRFGTCFSKELPITATTGDPKVEDLHSLLLLRPLDKRHTMSNSEIESL